MIHFVSFKMRTSRRLVRNESPHWIMTCSQLANPIKKQMCAPNHSSHASTPQKWQSLYRNPSCYAPGST